MLSETLKMLHIPKSNITIFDKPVVISIFKVNTTNGNISHDSFYDGNYFDKDLNMLSVEELIEEISKLKVYKQ